MDTNRSRLSLHKAIAFRIEWCISTDLEFESESRLHAHTPHRKHLFSRVSESVVCPSLDLRGIPVATPTPNAGTRGRYKTPCKSSFGGRLRFSISGKPSGMMPGDCCVLVNDRGEYPRISRRSCWSSLRLVETPRFAKPLAAKPFRED